jgi:hypothetical protein
MENEEQAMREVTARLARAERVMEQIDPGRLVKEQREMYSGIRDFIAKAQDAIQAKDVPRAQILADKASRLAEDLALKTRK